MLELSKYKLPEIEKKIREFEKIALQKSGVIRNSPKGPDIYHFNLDLANNYIENAFCHISSSFIIAYKHGNSSIYKILDEAKSLIANGIQQFEVVYSGAILSSLAKNMENVEKIKNYKEEDRYRDLLNTGLCIDMLEFAAGAKFNHKLSVAISVLKNRLINCMKNSLNLRNIKEGLGEDNKLIRTRLKMVKIVMNLIRESIDFHRTNYENNRSISSMQKAIQLVEAEIMLHHLFNEQRKIDECKKRIETWERKLEADK